MKVEFISIDFIPEKGVYVVLGEFANLEMISMMIESDFNNKNPKKCSIIPWFYLKEEAQQYLEEVKQNKENEIQKIIQEELHLTAKAFKLKAFW